MLLDPQLLYLQTKIGNSFLKAFYPIDYRNNQSAIRSIDKLLEREVRGLKALSTTTSRVSLKIGRALGSLADDIDEMSTALDNLQYTLESGDELLSTRMEEMEAASSNLLGFLSAAGALEGFRRGKNYVDSRRQPPAQSGGGGAPPPGRNTTSPQPKSKYKLPKGMTIIALAYSLWEMWQELNAIDPNLKKGEYKEEVLKIVSKAVASLGLMWVGAFLGTMVGSAFFGVGAIPGFIAGLLGGAAADYVLGDSVDQIVEAVVEYLYTGDDEEEEESLPTGADSTVINKEAPTLTPSLDEVKPVITPASAEVQINPPIQGPIPPAPLALVPLAGPVLDPPPVQEIALEYTPESYATSERSSAVIAEALQRATTMVSDESNDPDTVEYVQNLTGVDLRRATTEITPSLMSSPSQYDQGGYDTGASITTSQNLAGGIEDQPVIPSDSALGTTNVNIVEAYGPKRPGRPVQRIRSIAAQAAEAVGMKQIVFTSGVGDWISPERQAAGQKTTRHAHGDALDVTGFESTEQRNAFMRAARELGAGGIGAYGDGSVHIDLGRQREWDGAVGVPGLAEGAKVSKPTLALIGEAGEPEYVVPQSKVIKFAHEMLSARPRTIKKKHTHYVVLPIIT